MPNSLVESTHPKRDDCYYGAACLPTVRGFLWECASKEEYLEMRSAFEANEGNCNTCRHLTRVPHAKCVHGFLPGTCGKTKEPIRFHPEQPQQMSCWESRRGEK